jgi:O-antigen/teichoic acid export membrane protein
MTEPSPPNAPNRARPSVLLDVAGFAGSQYVLRFATLVKGFVVAKLLGPEGNGLWQHFVIISEYAQYSHVGALPGLNKVLGRRVGEGDEAGAAVARNTGTGSVLATAFVLWIGLIVFVVARGDALATHDRWGLPILGGIVLLEQLNFTYQALLRAYSRIKLISTVSAVFAFANLAVSLALLPKYKVLGLLAGWAITRLATTLWMMRRSGFPFRPSLDRACVKLLLVTGLPIFFFHLTRVGLRNIDRVLVDSVLAKADLGIYGIAVTLAGLIRYVADAVGFVIYPIFLRTYGETGDPRTLERHLVRPTEFLALFVPIVLGFSWLVLHLPVLWLLPAYEPSIAIFRMLTFSMAFSCLAILPGFFLMAIDRQNWLVPMGLAVIAFDWFAGRALIERGWGLPGVAAAMGVGSFAYCAVVLVYAGGFALGSLRGAVTWLGKVLLPFAYFAVVVALIRGIVPRTPLVAWGEVPRSLLEGAVFLAVSVPLLLAFERRHGVFASLRRRAGS